MNLLADLASEPHKYGIGVIGGFVLCFAISQALKFIDRRMG